MSNQEIALSSRERQIVDLVVEGRTNKQIAEELYLSENTIKTHMSRIFRKVGVNGRSQLAAWSLRSKALVSAEVMQFLSQMRDELLVKEPEWGNPSEAHRREGQIQILDHTLRLLGALEYRFQEQERGDLA